jgi:hypothetical protein
MTLNHDHRFLPEKPDNEVPVPIGLRKKGTPQLRHGATRQQFVTSWREKTRTPIRSGRSALRTPCGGGWAVGSLTMLIAKRLYKSGVKVRAYS